jgi:hypothetical protein
MSDITKIIDHLVVFFPKVLCEIVWSYTKKSEIAQDYVNMIKGKTILGVYEEICDCESIERYYKNNNQYILVFPIKNEIIVNIFTLEHCACCGDIIVLYKFPHDKYKKWTVRVSNKYNLGQPIYYVSSILLKCSFNKYGHMFNTDNLSDVIQNCAWSYCCNTLSYKYKKYGHNYDEIRI